MESVALDPGVFIRSMATRGSLGGLAGTTRELCDVLDAFGVDRILIETVGVGQSELEIARTADQSVVVLVPESGDSIQAMKAVEIGDGWDNATRRGSEVHDELRYEEGYRRDSNRAGGLEGGMTNGEPVVVRIAMKPLPTLMKPLRTATLDTHEPAEALLERSDTTAIYAAAVVAVGWPASIGSGSSSKPPARRSASSYSVCTVSLNCATMPSHRCSQSSLWNSTTKSSPPTWPTKSRRGSQCAITARAAVLAIRPVTAFVALLVAIRTLLAVSALLALAFLAFAAMAAMPALAAT